MMLAGMAMLKKYYYRARKFVKAPNKLLIILILPWNVVTGKKLSTRLLFHTIFSQYRKYMFISGCFMLNHHIVALLELQTHMLFH